MRYLTISQVSGMRDYTREITACKSLHSYFQPVEDLPSLSGPLSESVSSALVGLCQNLLVQH